MDVNDPQWALYEARFLALADNASLTTGPKPLIGDTKVYLCLYGENGLSSDQEFAILQQLEQAATQSSQALRKIEVETCYWQDVILYLP
jgi:hypothetical protein